MVALRSTLKLWLSLSLGQDRSRERDSSLEVARGHDRKQQPLHPRDKVVSGQLVRLKAHGILETGGVQEGREEAGLGRVDRPEAEGLVIGARDEGRAAGGEENGDDEFLMPTAGLEGLARLGRENLGRAVMRSRRQEEPVGGEGDRADKVRVGLDLPQPLP